MTRETFFRALSLLSMLFLVVLVATAIWFFQSLSHRAAKTQETANYLQNSLDGAEIRIRELEKSIELKQLMENLANQETRIKNLEAKVTSLTKELQATKSAIASLNERTSGFRMSQGHATMTTGDGKIQLLLVPNGQIVLRKFDDLPKGTFHQKEVSVIR